MGGDGGGEMNWEIGIDIYTPICIKWINNKNLLYTKINKRKEKEVTVFKRLSQNLKSYTLFDQLRSIVNDN